MKLLIVFIKEIAEYLLRNFKILRANIFNSHKNIEVDELVKDGIIIKSGFYSKNDCYRLRKKIDEYIDTGSANVWVDDEEADHRIYFINEIDEEFNKFYEHPEIRKYLSAYTGALNPKGMLLASRIDFKNSNKGSGGGWHRDSPISHQFKAICYLNDVTESNGCFQFIKGSHSKRNVLYNYIKKAFMPRQFRFTDDEILNYLELNETEVTSVTGKTGDLVLVDTKGIHRGKPLEVGSRYVLFCYFWDKQIPVHFSDLRQN